MYGLINRALQRMVVEQHGREAWDSIRRDAGLDVEVFVTMQTYPDAVTYDLVGAASRQLDAPAEVLLEAFGQYWIRVIAPEGYGPLLDFAGTSFVEFLRNLDAMHERIALAFADLEQPSFAIEETAPTALLVHYRSKRPGLAPFVVGVLKGLGERFGHAVQLQHALRAADGADHDVFEVTFA